jgi:hypothetical protein
LSPHASSSGPAARTVAATTIRPNIRFMACLRDG